MARRVFAINLGRWIELRSALRTPKPMVSSVTKAAVIPANKMLGTGERKVTREIKVTYYQGGIHICTTHFTKLTDLGVRLPKTGGIVEIQEPLATNLRSKSWRRTYLGENF